jgi:hypothetical protein
VALKLQFIRPFILECEIKFWIAVEFNYST